MDTIGYEEMMTKTPPKKSQQKYPNIKQMNNKQQKPNKDKCLSLFELL
jgi:hypothetical protein